MPNWIRPWPGGRVHKSADGSISYVIRKSHKGRRYVVTLRVATEQQAMAELALFLRDPPGYTQRSEEPLRPVVAAPLKVEKPKLPEPSVGAYLESRLFDRLGAHQRAEGLTENHIREVRHYLTEWALALAGMDIGTLGADLPPKNWTESSLRISLR